MGLERIASVLQGVDSNYETDLLGPIIDRAAALAKTLSGSPETLKPAEREVAYQVIADHVRAMTFLMSDGVVPSNDGRGYVLRRIMRRAIRFGRSLGIEKPFLCELSGSVVDVMKGPYADLEAHRGLVAQIARREEERFAETLAIGLARVEDLARSMKDRRETVIPGQEAFKLYDTFGLPIDLIRDVAQAWSLQVDETGFDEAMRVQRERSRRRMKDVRSAVTGVVDRLPVQRIDFRGYDETRLENARVLAVIVGDRLVDELNQGEEGQVLLDRTPFYAEAGGQVGDTGFLTGESAAVEVRDTQAPIPLLNLHAVRVREGRLRTGDTVDAEVDRARRLAVMRSHDATHLVHAALRDVVGTHVKQAGSLVGPDRFRFDFSHYASLSDEILRQVEDDVNDVIRQDLPIVAAVMPLDEALRRGALAFFGDKYGDRVRVIEIPGYSMELCGGTHAPSTGSIGILKLVQERGIAAGVRRVEALAGSGALSALRQDRQVVDRLQSALNVDRERLGETLASLLEQNRTLKREVERMKIDMAAGAGREGQEEIREYGRIKVMVRGPQAGLEKSALRALVDRSRERMPSGVIVQWALREGRATITASVSRDLIPPLHAGEMDRTFEIVEGAIRRAEVGR
jgi:alanyl-tRNA synthetase